MRHGCPLNAKLRYAHAPLCLRFAELAACVASGSIADALSRLFAGGSGLRDADSFGRTLSDTPRVTIELVMMTDIIGMLVDYIGTWVGFDQQHV